MPQVMKSSENIAHPEASVGNKWAVSLRGAINPVTQTHVLSCLLAWQEVVD